MRLVVAAALVLIGCYLPLIVVGTLDPTANPVGLGLLSLLGPPIAAILIVIAIVRALWRLLARRG